MKRTRQFFYGLGLGAIVILLLSGACTAPKQGYDILIKGARVVDGSGNPWYPADIGIRGGKIAAIERVLDEGDASEVIAAQGMIIAPGFIDVHTHVDRGILQNPSVENYISQGVTTVVGGNCGGHEFPLAEFFAAAVEKGIALNIAMLAGHNTIRREVMALKMEAPTAEEMSRMKDLLDREMRSGAIGLSTGLAYLPGVYSKTEEIVELARAVAPYNGIYASHIRNQAEGISGAIREAIAVGEANGISIIISHIKLADETIWNRPELITGPVEEAKARGLEVYLDQYPYTATSSGFTSSFPQEVFEGGKDKFKERLNDPAVYLRVKNHLIERRLTSRRGINKLQGILVAECRTFPDYEGKNLEQILELLQKEPSVENAGDLIIEIEKAGGASAVFFQMDEADVETLMRLPYLMIGSDGAVQVRGRGFPHPRSYGTFPRIIGRYVREKGVLRLEEAIRKMTSLPAQALKIKDRGQIREGMWADVVVFDPQTFEDAATFASPHQFGRGPAFVLVNGEIVFNQGGWTGRLPGKPLFGKGKTG
ncbi:MAG: D-aminoacylase [Candidatus Aminicenantes bacterium]|nr:D-aminoacylase [Candidatus Aminicenantes bacterium]